MDEETRRKHFEDNTIPVKKMTREEIEAKYGKDVLSEMSENGRAAWETQRKKNHRCTCEGCWRGFLGGAPVWVTKPTGEKTP